MSTTATQHEFTMDQNLLVSVIKSQAGTLSKALLEGVMNSIDAGSARVDITLTTSHFVIEDTGRGFTSEEEIRMWFGRFGTPHVEGDAVYGKFRMGRGQLFSYAKTVWHSGVFKLAVDIESRGLSYDVETVDTPVRGCRVEGELYQQMATYRLADTLAELKKFVAFAPKPVFVNGEQFGVPAAKQKCWSFEDDDAYYKVVQDSTEMAVYNQGVFVEAMSTWRTGLGGIIVTKKPLMVNFARNSVLEDQCPVWARITKGLENTVLSKLTTAKKLSPGERRYVARRLPRLVELLGRTAYDAKVLTDPSGKHIALGKLREFTRFVYVSEATPTACAAHGYEGIFVVTDELLTRFATSSLEEWLRNMSALPGVLALEYSVVTAKDIAKYGLGAAEQLGESVLATRERAAFAALSRLNDMLAQRLQAAGVVHSARNLLIGRHKNADFVAWTDGATYITANRRYLKRLEQGLDGVAYWLHVLVHEYMHDTDDSESHAHGEVFYRKFHDTLLDSMSVGIGQLAQIGVKVYLEELSKLGAPRPHVLTRQLRPLDYNPQPESA